MLQRLQPLVYLPSASTSTFDTPKCCAVAHEMEFAAAEETGPKPCPLPATKQPEMYRVWYKMLIKKVCLVAKGISEPRHAREKTKGGKPSPLARMDDCLDAWAENLSVALSTPLPDGVEWSQHQYADVYRQLWALLSEVWLGMNTQALGRWPQDRKQLVEFVVRDL